MGGGRTYTVTGILLSKLFSEYAAFGTYAEGVRFFGAGDTFPTSGSNSFIPSTTANYDGAMLIWERTRTDTSGTLEIGLWSALEGGSGMYWWGNVTGNANIVTTIGVSLPDSTLTFTTTPSTAIIAVKDPLGTPVTSESNGTYIIKQGAAYSYEVSAGGYVADSGTITATSGTASKSVTLTASGGGGTDPSYTVTSFTSENGSITASPATATAGTEITLTIAPKSGYKLTSISAGGATVGGSGNTRTFTMPAGNVTLSATFAEAVFELYSQKGISGAKVLEAAYTQAEFNALATTNAAGYAYLYSANNGSMIVAAGIVTLDELFDNAGITSNWKVGSYLDFATSDSPGGYNKAYSAYENLQECKYYIDGSTQNVVPSGIATIWNSGKVSDNGGSQSATLTAVAAAAKVDSLRFVYGISPSQYNANPAANESITTAMGARSPYGVTAMTLVYDAGKTPTGSVGLDGNGGGSDSDTASGKKDETETKTDDATTTDTTAIVATGTFGDVADNAWYAEAVEYVAAKGLMNGVGEGNFAPNSKLSRAMLVTILHRYAGMPPVDGGKTFNDVPLDTWYSDAALWAAEIGVVNGVGEGNFAPNDDITREQFAVIMFRFARHLGIDTSAAADLSGYDDADSISSWAKDAMAWANAVGLINGRSATELVPNGTATRAEAATLLMRFIESVL